jgi:hypothetical protein
VGSYPLLSQAPSHVEVELGCDNYNFISSNWQGSIFSGQSGRSRGTVIEDKAVTFQVLILWIFLKIKEEMSEPKKRNLNFIKQYCFTLVFKLSVLFQIIYSL